MMAIFDELIEDIMEVCMDAFLVFIVSFGLCLRNLERFSFHYEETNLGLN